MGKRFAFVSLGFLFLLVLLYAQLFLSNGAAQAEEGSEMPASRMIIISKENDLSYRRLRASAELAAGQYAVYVENQTLSSWEETSLRDSVVFAIKSGADAVAFQSSDPQFNQEMDELAKEHGVLLVLYESENYRQDSVLAVGSNSYTIGTISGNLAIEAAGGEECKAVLVLDKSREGAPSTYQNMKMQGVMEAFGAVEGAEIVQTLFIEEGVLEGEELARTLVSLQNSYNTVICLHSRTVPLIAQRIIDSNLVGKVNIVGYGMQEQTLDYIRRGVIYATVTPDADQIGEGIVAMVHARLNGEPCDDNLYVSLYTITAGNVEQFQELWLGEGE